MKKNIKKYEIDIFDEKQLENLENVFGNIKQALESEEFMNFLALKCMEELKLIIDTNLGNEEYTTDYRESNKYEVSKDQIRIFNDSMVDLSELSDETATYYSEGLSLAKIIEFGTGVPGTDSDDYEWKTEANTRVKANGQPVTDYNKGWWYIRNGQLHFTRGQQGHFIYQKLMTSVQDKIQEWFIEYLQDKLD